MIKKSLLVLFLLLGSCFAQDPLDIEVWDPSGGITYKMFDVPIDSMVGLKSPDKCFWRKPSDHKYFAGFEAVIEEKSYWCFLVYTGTKPKDINVECYIEGSTIPKICTLKVRGDVPPDPDVPPGPDVPDLTGTAKIIYEAAKAVPESYRRADSVMLADSYEKVSSEISLGRIASVQVAYKRIQEELDRFKVGKSWAPVHDIVRKKLDESPGVKEVGETMFAVSKGLRAWVK